MRVVVAMSGGVDSSTTAALLKEQGHEVIGLAMKTHALATGGSRACCTPEDLRDARRVADQLGIAFYVLNYEELFRREVVEPFARAYARGQTPNPCIACNDKVKFGPLLMRAELLGADRLATGHYARLETVDGQPALCRGVDPHKDQSYFLYRLAKEQLGKIIFPLGGLTKDQVRDHARRLGLEVAEKSESQEICFVGCEGYARTVEQTLGAACVGGNIVDRAGAVLGRHPGVHHFTLGQRRGLGVAAGAPIYVTALNPDTNEVRVGPREDLLVDEIGIENALWRCGPPTPSQVVSIQQRYRERPRPGRVVEASGGRARVVFSEPTMRSAPGQAAVIFLGDMVLGGGVIAP